ncbi:MAG: O-antigen ligase family protein [Actinobacteria bacterium]|nr:O-antigen ligase family protein [Actinomycetota bacterium]NDC90266.1 O-antigen ligase family protein [Acidimicrobiia bacterium]NBP41560.1 O-antigen ligase family protein [Actinomycetota bacterium]NBQ04072.1 O-antigen ligase family protein [Actinomycetota bacterium]NDA96470.1 O-antigen ligase family protein [Actinomycetota bacterium]
MSTRVDYDSVRVPRYDQSGVLKWVEYLYVVIMLAVLTQGPVLKIWEGSGQSGSTILETTKYSTYLLFQLPAVVLLARRGVSQNMLRGPVGVLLGFCTWMLLSTGWATASSYSLVASVSLFITCLAGLYVARSFTLLQQLTLFLVAMQPGLVVSWYAVRNNWSGAVNFDENYWIGIYFNRNSFAPPAALGFLAAGALAWILIVRRPRFWAPLTVVLADVMLLDLGLLIRSKSSTSIGAIGLFIFVWAFWTLVRQVQRKKLISARQMLQTVYPLFLFVMILLTWIGFKFQKYLFSFFNNKLDFSGRTMLWRFSWDGFLDKPILGWGWFSAWNTPNFFHEREFWWAISNTTWSHSAIMDVLLGGGVVGAGLLVLAILWSGARQLERVQTQNAGQWTFAATWFVLAASTQESFIVGNHFMWLLLVAAMSGSRDDKVRKV